MSWSLTVDDLDQVDQLPDELLSRVGSDNPLYSIDARLAFTVACAAGLVSATLSGGRTPSPYGGADTVVISVVGFSDRREGHAVARKFYPTMIDTITAEMTPNEHWRLPLIDDEDE